MRVYYVVIGVLTLCSQYIDQLQTYRKLENDGTSIRFCFYVSLFSFLRYIFMIFFSCFAAKFYISFFCGTLQIRSVKSSIYLCIYILLVLKTGRRRYYDPVN